MNAFSRGVRNAFRNQIRTFSIVIILGLSVGLALAMLLAHQAVGQKINSVKSSVGNTITISPAGVHGFEGGGNPLTQAQLDKISGLPHVSKIEESLNDRLTTSDTSLQSSVDLGQLGQRFARNGGTFDGGGFGDGTAAPTSFTPPVTVLGSSDPTDLASTQGGGTFTLKSGQVFASDSTDNVALVGSALASKNNLSVGSTFTAYSATIKVFGIFDSGNSFSNGLLILPLKTLQTLSSQSGDVTSAVVTVDSISNIDSLTSSIKADLGSAADVTSSKDQAQNSLTPLQNIQSISLYSLIGAVIAGAVIIFLTMLMIVRERRREIGVIKAIGASNTKVVFQFMTEAVTLTIMGAVIGIALGVVAGNPITKLLVNNSSNSTSAPAAAGVRILGGGGGSFTPRTGGGRGFGFVRNNISSIHAAVGWSIILYGLAAALVIAIVGSAVASWSIAKIRPAEVLRTE